MKIAFFGTNKEEQAILSELITGTENHFFAEGFTNEHLEEIKDLDILCTFVGSQITSQVMDLFPNLKLIATRSTGFDHIDVAYAKEKGVVVTNVPAYGANTVAEFTFALIMALSRGAHNAYSHLKAGTFKDPQDFRGFDLFGKTLGVVGTGKIGQNVIKIGKGFGMKIEAFDVYPNEAFAKEQGFNYSALAEVLKRADIVTLHVPYNEGTHHLINQGNIGNLKQGAYIINTARGEVLETEALLMALKSGQAAGAGLDVLEGEKEMQESYDLFLGRERRAVNYKLLLENHLLLDLENVIVTPHVAFCTEEAERRILEVTAENILNFVKGEKVNSV